MQLGGVQVKAVIGQFGETKKRGKSFHQSDFRVVISPIQKKQLKK
jgi:hypothetical protein